MSKIEWTDRTWNPTVGCSRVSEGCRNCYAERMAGTRLAHLPDYAGTTHHNAAGKPVWTGKVNLLEHRLDDPRHWKKPCRVFVNSMSDLFHEEIPFDFIDHVYGIMAHTPQHIFQVLTKRPERMLEWSRLTRHFIDPKIWEYGRNIWLGVSVERQEEADKRIPLLIQVPAEVHFLSCEPLIAPLDIARFLPAVSWVIVGGESGPGARQMRHWWAQELRNQCILYRIPFFFKQWGEYDSLGARVGKTKAGRRLNGEEWNQFPTISGGLELAGMSPAGRAV